ncbi:MAG: hypothetical protein EOO09_16190 [Chitinophagaceae bacterium]|nr:MAG: hypothetical protein EOO09_16190 [Chitinophagaceae bacterium]
MINHRPHILLLLLVSGLAAKPLLAQTSVKISADRTQILIGEQIRLTLEADIPENEAIGFFNPDSLAHFEIISKGKVDTSNTSKGTVLKGVITITSFDSGHWVIPRLLLRDSIYTDSIPVDVGYTPFDTQKPYNDIKEIVAAEKEKPETGLKWWYFAIAAVVLLVIGWLLFRRKPKPAPVAVKQDDPLTQAMRDLDALDAARMPKDLFYSGLVNVFRVYVQRRRGIESMQQTTGDLVQQLRVIGLPEADYDRLAAALQFSDLVKFARFDASTAEATDSQLVVRNNIRLIEELTAASLPVAVPDTKMGGA